MGRGQKAPQGRLSSSTCKGPKKHHDSLISKYLKTVHFHELSQRCQPSHMDHHSHQFTNACWQMGRMDVPDKGSWEAVLQEKSRGGRTGRYFQIFWAKQITLSYQRKSLSGDKPEEFPAFDRILYLRNLRVAALSATELEVRVTLCHFVTLSPSHPVTLPLCHSSLSPCQLFKLSKGAIDCYEF